MRESSMTPIAVVGMACRLPGGIDSPRKLWEALLRGEDLVTEIPRDRWDAEENFDPEPGVAGRSVSKWGAFLDDVTGFDPDFGINEREATAMDPNIACCWKPPGRPSSMPGAPRRRWRERLRACSSACPMTTTPWSPATRAPSIRPTRSPVTRSAWLPAGSRTRWVCTVRR